MYNTGELEGVYEYFLYEHFLHFRRLFTLKRQSLFLRNITIYDNSLHPTLNEPVDRNLSQRFHSIIERGSEAVAIIVIKKH